MPINRTFDTVTAGRNSSAVNYKGAHADIIGGVYNNDPLSYNTSTVTPLAPRESVHIEMNEGVELPFVPFKLARGRNWGERKELGREEVGETSFETPDVVLMSS